MIKKALKVIIPCLFATVLVVLLCFNCFTKKTDLKYNGKGSCEIEVVSELAENEFKTYANRTISEYNEISGDDDYWKLEGIEKCDGGYKVKVSFRRIDKVKGPGDFYLQDFSAFTRPESANLALLKNLRDGNWKNTWISSLDGKQVSVSVDKTKKGSQKFAVTNATGEEKNTLDEDADDYFFAEKHDKSKVFLFRIVGLQNVKSLKFSVYGKIEYIGCAGESVKLTAENAIEAFPVRGQAVIDSQTDENGEFIKTDMNFIFGYIVYTPYMSPATLSVIVICSLFALFAILSLVFYLIKRGEKIAAEAAKKTTDEAGGKKSCAFIVGVKSALGSDKFKLMRKQKLLYFLILPAIALLFVFNYLPLGGLIIAFKDYAVTEGVNGSEWIGLKNFKQIFIEPTTNYYLAIRNTIYISILRIVTNFPMILIFALLLNEVKSKKARGFFQTISYIPFFISWVAVGSLTSNMFMDDGVLNKLITACGGTPVSWYTDEKPWWSILSITTLWKGMGWGTLIYISAMGTIDDELYDACLIDGGGKFRQAITVTLPGISNVITLQLLLDVSSLLGDNAEQIMALTNGNNDALSNLQVIGTGIIGTITGGGSYSLSTAIGLFQSVVGLILVLVMNKIAKKTEHEGIL